MFVVFDIETTGLIGSTCDIIEFSYILFDSNNKFVRSEQLYFYYPGMSWNEEAYKVHRIELEDLKTHKEEFKQNIVKMYAVLNRANVAGHNVKQFDCPFVKQWLTRMGINNLEFGIVVDTMVAYKPIYKRPRIKLTKLSEIMGFSDEFVQMMAGCWFPDAYASRPHEAAYDVTMTSLLVLRGLEEGWISFNLNRTKAVEVTANDMEDVLTTKEIKESDPNEFMIRLVDEGEDEHNAYDAFVNHDYSKYVTKEYSVGDEYRYGGRNRLFPYYLIQEEGTNKYSVKVMGTTYIYERDTDLGDKFMISNELASLYDTDLNIEAVIQSLEKMRIEEVNKEE